MDEQIITDYLLGALPEGQTEQLDEMSLTDDGFAGRVRAVENDLVDAYVRGELSGNILSRFKSHYLASPKRREKVLFAKTFINVVDGSTVTTTWAQSRRPIWIRFFAVSHPAAQWGFAAAALIMLLISGYLIFDNSRLHNQIAKMEVQRNALQQRERKLQESLSNTEEELSQEREVIIIAFNLSPQTRGISKLPLILVPIGTDYLELNLELETNDFSIYQTTLKNPATANVLWKSEGIKSGSRNFVEVRLPAGMLKSQNYVLELSGIAPNGAAEILSSYPFRVAVQ